MITSSLTIVVNKAEIKKQIAISIDRLRRSLFVNNINSTIKVILNIRLACYCTFEARLQYVL